MNKLWAKLSLRSRFSYECGIAWIDVAELEALPKVWPLGGLLRQQLADPTTMRTRERK